MEETYSAIGIILNRTPFRENDLKVLVYSSEKGKISLIAKGAQKFQSKLVGHLEPMTLSKIMIIKGKKYNYLGSAINQESFLNIKADLEKMAIGGRSIRLFNELVKWEEVDENLFKFLQKYLTILNKFNISQNSLTYEAFALKLLSIIGYKPELDFCNKCRKKINEEFLFFDPKRGTLVCDDCACQGKNLELKITTSCQFFLRFILNNDFEKIFKYKFELKDKEKAELKKFVELFCVVVV